MKIIAAAVIIAVLALGGYLVLREDGMETTTENQSTTMTNEGAEQQQPESTAPAEESVITYTDNGFNPGSVKKLAKTIKNDSSSTLDFESNVHPTHQDNTDLNVGTIEPGESATFQTKAGTWGFHNHLKPADTGTVVVER